MSEQILKKRRLQLGKRRFKRDFRRGNYPQFYWGKKTSGAAIKSGELYASRKM